MTPLERTLLDRMDTVVAFVEAIIEKDGFRDDMANVAADLRHKCEHIRSLQDAIAAGRALALRESGAVMGQDEVDRLVRGGQ